MPGLVDARPRRFLPQGAVAHPVRVEPAVGARMRDGVELVSTVYRPDVPGRFPVLLTRTPYGRDLGVNSAYLNPWRVAALGFVVIMQDCRGRFGSEGEFVPSVNEVADGADTVEWAAGLPYADGTVGMWGRSYFAETQWRAALSRPRGLAALAPGVSAGGNAADGALFRGGVFELGSRLGWGHASAAVDVIGRDPDPESAAREMALWEGADRSLTSGDLLGTLPVSALSSRLPSFVSEHVLRTAAQRPDGPDAALWDEPTREVSPLPTLSIGGWFDIFLATTLDTHCAQAAAHAAGEAGPAHVVIGPWSHSNLSGIFPDRHFGTGANAAVMGGRGDLSSLHAAWFAEQLGGAPRRSSELPVALVFFQGADVWREFDAMPEPDGTVELSLRADGGLDLIGVDAAGPDLAGPSVTVPDASSGQDAATVHFDDDPRDPVPTVGGATMLVAQQPGPADQRRVEARDDVVCFTSAPLTQPLTLLGRVTAHLRVATSAVDTDFVVRLCVVDAEGVSRSVLDGVSRASWRAATAGDGRFRPGHEAEPVVPGREFDLDVDLWATALTVREGERLRVQVTSSSHPRWERNLNTGRSAWDSAEAVVAHQSVVCGGPDGSRLSVGVLRTPVLGA